MAVLRLEQLTKQELIEQLRSLQCLVGGQQGTDWSPDQKHSQHDGRMEKRPAQDRRDAWPPAQEAANYYANLYAFAPVGCLSLDANGCIEEINVAGAAMLGWERSWLLGQPFARWIAKDDIERFPEHLRKVRTSSGKVVTEVRIKDHHGQPVDVRLESIMIDGGDPAAAVCQTALIDVTEGRRAEREARLLQAELAHVARLSTMGELASSLAHELNQPLGTVVLYCDTCLRMLRSGAIDQAKLMPALDQVSQAAQRASEIIRHLRSFLRKDAEHRETAELNTLVRDAVKLVEADVRDKGGTIHLDLTTGLSPVTVDRVHIEQVLLNLIRNGIEAMDAAGAALRTVTISTRRSTDQQLGICVHDTGPGLSAKDCGRAFEPFYTTKPSGMGMGLPISRSIIEAHAGRLWGEPGAQGGAMFCFTLPVTKGEASGAKTDRIRRRR